LAEYIPNCGITYENLLPKLLQLQLMNKDFITIDKSINLEYDLTKSFLLFFYNESILNTLIINTCDKIKSLITDNPNNLNLMDNDFNSLIYAISDFIKKFIDFIDIIQIKGNLMNQFNETEFYKECKDIIMAYTYMKHAYIPTKLTDLISINN